MGASLCSFRRLPKEDGAREEGSVQPNMSTEKCIISSNTDDEMKKQKQKQKKKNKKRELQYYQNKKVAKVKKLTLEDCLLASPGVKKDYSIRGGELHVFRHYCSSSSSKVHPSAGTSRVIPDHVKSEPLITEQHDKEDQSLVGSSSLSRSQSGKMIKKKVSFRMPKESDIILFDPQEEISCGKC